MLKIQEGRKISSFVHEKIYIPYRSTLVYAVNVLAREKNCTLNFFFLTQSSQSLIKTQTKIVNICSCFRSFA